MFNFFRKEKKIILDCFTKITEIYEYAKIDSAARYIPQWWKDTPRDRNDVDRGTIKNCVAFRDYYAKGIVIPSWFEMNLTIYEQNNIENKWFDWESSNKFVNTDRSHHPAQFEKFAQSDGKNLKLHNPWGFKTKENIFFTATQPTWNLRDQLEYLSILPAIVNFKYQHFCNINFFILNKDKVGFCNIPALTPLVILHPLTEKKVIVKNHLISEREWNKIFGIYNFIIKDNHGYAKKKRLIDFLHSY
jgi:hypothetical protein